MNVKEMVSDGKTVRFLKFQENTLWYVTETGFEFPVPVTETPGAVFKDTDGAMFFMRWIRKHVDFVEVAKKEQELSVNR